MSADQNNFSAASEGLKTTAAAAAFIERVTADDLPTKALRIGTGRVEGAEVGRHGRTLLGPAQLAWLKDGLSKSAATWNVLAQQVMMARVDRIPGEVVAVSMDQWPGYEAKVRNLPAIAQDRSMVRGFEREALGTGLPQENCYVNVLRDAMAVDALDSCGIYFGTTGGQVYASADAGDSWAPIVRDLPAVVSVEVQTLAEA